MISFVIYYHSSRLNNLKQTLRLLRKREPDLDGELILVCQDEFEFKEDTGFETSHYNLNLPFYHKTKMCNFGVNKANYDFVALLDSDRILPQNYFKKCLTLMEPGTFLSTENLYNLKKDYTDEEIENEDIKLSRDFRSTSNKLFRKNLFAGNTLMFKHDYLESGGMDEKFIGYGFADTDMTQNVTSKGYKTLFLKEKELHLSHPKYIIWDNKKMNQYRLVSFINAIKYCLKWKKLDDFLLMKDKIENENFEGYSQEMMAKYNKEKSKIEKMIKWL